MVFILYDQTPWSLNSQSQESKQPFLFTFSFQYTGKQRDLSGLLKAGSTRNTLANRSH
jgi:hypothetical protein